MPKYPNIRVPLSKMDSNSFLILGRCNTLMKENGLQEEFPVFLKQAISKDFDTLIRTVMDWFNVE